MDKQKFRAEIFAKINAHRDEQNRKHGKRNKTITLVEYGNVLSEENGEVIKEINEVHFEGKSIVELKKELIQTATVCVAILEFLEESPDYREEEESPEPKDIEVCAVDVEGESELSTYHFEVDFRYSFRHQNGDWHPTGDVRYFAKSFQSDSDAFAYINENCKEIFAEFHPNRVLSGWQLKKLVRQNEISLPDSWAKFNKCS